MWLGLKLTQGEKGNFFTPSGAEQSAVGPILLNLGNFCGSFSVSVRTQMESKCENVFSIKLLQRDR